MGTGLKTFIVNRGTAKGCVVLLPGRFGSALHLMQLYQAAELHETTLVGIEPEVEWYPIPNGVGDQIDAVRGMKKSRKSLLRHLNLLEKHSGLSSHQIALVGFSAGAVMAVQCALRSDKEFAGVVAHSGAILQPRKTPTAWFPDMPFLLIHNRQDDCFNWHERYLPMKKALSRRGHSVQTVEKNDPASAHALTYEDVVSSAIFLAPRLGYSDWQHSTQR